MESQPNSSTTTATADDKTTTKMHIVMFPWLAFGHMIPYLELAKSIAQKGHKISFISTPRNIERLPKFSPKLSHFIDLVPLTLPHIEELPNNAQATTDVSPDDVHYLKKVYDGLEDEFARFLRGNSRSVDWVIHDFSAYWVPPVAEKMGIGSVFFSIVNGFFQGFMGPASAALDGGWSDPRKELIDFTKPPEWVRFPTKVAFRLHEIKRLFSGNQNNASGVSDPVRVGLTISRCDLIAIRHSLEFEPEWITLIQEQNHKLVIPLGLMPPSPQENEDENSNTWDTIRSYLDKQKDSSVIYVALGSEATLTQEELNQLALGLELSELPFFWVLRSPRGSTLELPYGFEDRVKGRGIVWVTWAPQLKILAHESVGGFLTHCGWSSVIEGLQCGLPFIMLPLMVDQGLNARVLEDKKLGIEIPRDEKDGSFDKKLVSESLRLIMVEKEGERFKTKAKEMMGIFGDMERQNRYLCSFLEYLEKNKRSRER